MALLNELLGSFEGQLSLAVLIFILAMAVFFIRMFLKNIEQDTPK